MCRASLCCRSRTLAAEPISTTWRTSQVLPVDGRRIAASVGISIGRWDYTVEVTPAIREALLEWDRKPKRGAKLPKLKGKLGFREFDAEPDTGGVYARSW